MTASYNNLIALRDLIINDPAALTKFATIVDRIVKAPAEVFQIKGLLTDRSYAEAVLQSLQVWYSCGSEREDLVQVLRDLGLHVLADAVIESNCSSLLRELKIKRAQPKIVNPDQDPPEVFLTSRDVSRDPMSENEIHLQVLKIDDAVQLVQTQLPKSTRENALKLADKLQRLPAALQPALAYIRGVYPEHSPDASEDEWTLKYLSEFKDYKADLLRDGRFKNYDKYCETTFATWKITFAKMKEICDGAGAIKLIRVLAYLNPDLISVQFVRAIFGAETEPAVELLQNFSMVQLGEGKVVIHRLLQRIIRLSLKEQEEDKVVGLVTSAIAEELKKKVFNDLSCECTWQGFHLFPFLVRHDELMKENTQYLSDLCYFLAQYANYEKCLSVSQQSAALYESILGEDHESTLQMKFREGDAYRRLCKFTDSMLVLDSILPTAKSKLGPDHELTLLILSATAEVSSMKGDHAKVLQIYDQVIPTAERVLGQNSANVLYYKNSKAVALRQLGGLDESLKLLQDVYEMQVRIHGNADHRTLYANAEIGFVHYEKKEYAKALEIWEEVETGYRNILGGSHPLTIEVQTHIAEAKSKLAGPAAAE